MGSQFKRICDSSRKSGYLAIVICMALFAGFGRAGADGPTRDRDRALRALRDGNQRFLSGQMLKPPGQSERNARLAGDIPPLACIVTGADARVSPEIIFDAQIGDLYVVRIPGGLISDDVIGAVEFAVEHLHVPVIVVLGHTASWPIGAAVGLGGLGGFMDPLAGKTLPAISIAAEKGYSGSRLIPAAGSELARMNAGQLMVSSRIIEEAVLSGQTTLLSACLDLSSGQVQWLAQMVSTPEGIETIPEPSEITTFEPVYVPPASAPVEEPAVVLPAQEPEKIEPLPEPEKIKPPPEPESVQYTRRHRF